MEPDLFHFQPQSLTCADDVHQEFCFLTLLWNVENWGSNDDTDNVVWVGSCCGTNETWIGNFRAAGDEDFDTSDGGDSVDVDGYEWDLL